MGMESMDKATQTQIANIENNTGKTLQQWIDIVNKSGFSKHGELVNFLKEKHKEENFILPETITIQEFITTYSSFIIKDDWYLLLELYQIQNELTKTHQRLEKFLPWGKLILKDFDECDKYLVNATQLFSVLRSHKEVDAAFSISEETKKYIEQFILTTSTKEKESIFKDNFIKTWS